MANTLFRRRFGFSMTKSSFASRKICDLIVDPEQKSNHLNLMQESTKFS